MATPLAPPPDNPAPNLDAQPAMRAIRISTSHQMTIDLSNGSSRNITIPAGTVGYLTREIPPNKCEVQLVNDKGQRLDCTVPRRVVEMGKYSSQFAFRHPRMRQGQLVTTLSSQRANDPTGKAIRFLWDDIHANMGALSSLGLKIDKIAVVLNDQTKKRDALNIIIASFSNPAWTALNTPGLPINAFRNVPRITDSSPTISDNQIMVYLRIYIDGTRFATYAGRSIQPITRQRQHETATEDPTNHSPHYVTARTFPKANRYALQMMLLTDQPETVISMAETTLCCLLGTWNPALSQPSQTAIQSDLRSADVSAVSHKLLMASFCSIVGNALQRANYPIMRGVGCNWNLPLHEPSRERREWIRYPLKTSDNRSMLVYRCQSRARLLYPRGMDNPALGVHLACGSGTDANSSFAIMCCLDNMPGLTAGHPVIFSIELMEDQKPHPTPWYRGPVHGAWSNSHELHSFGIKVEWKDETNNQWYTYPVRPETKLKMFPGADSAVTYQWKKATSILQLLHNRRYRNPPSYLPPSFRPLIRHVVYDHLDQSVSFEQVPQVVVDPPSHVSFQHNFEKLINASDTRWPEIAVGVRPPMSWFNQSTGTIRPGPCLMCMQLRGQSLVSHCSNREGNFAVAANEPHRDRILQGSCGMCWLVFRRPCIWIKHGFARDPDGGQYGVILPPEYEGVGIAPQYKGEAIPIEAPMTLEMYEDCKANQGLADADDEVVDEED
ncbi:hypothetical protein FLONG3_10561 [Fusarium longipes]|uniref:Uncharacterized protein n=1 Tax=Fusarium longipes TaxID=694270 RepID=A0A395RMH7_9HYPO|nr:hypothetical protein FLONG3_10561 [Fusarium longipes]